MRRSEQALVWQHTFGRPMPPRLHRTLVADCLLYEQQVQAARGTSRDAERALTSDPPEISTLIRHEAQRWSETWSMLDLVAQRRALLACGLRVTVERTQLRLSVAREGLLALLEGTPRSLHRRGSEDSNPLIRTVEAAVIRLYGETRILEDETETARAVAPMHQTLLRAIAQGRVWHQQLISGEVDLPTLMSRVGIARIQIQRKLQRAWLASDLIEGLLEDRASSRLSLASVRAHFTMDWAAQRRLWA